VVSRNGRAGLDIKAGTTCISHKPFLNFMRIGHHGIDVVWPLIAVQQSLPVINRGLREPGRSA
jgi:hypothetical protein